MVSGEGGEERLGTPAANCGGRSFPSPSSPAPSAGARFLSGRASDADSAKRKWVRKSVGKGECADGNVGKRGAATALSKCEFAPPAETGSQCGSDAFRRKRLKQTTIDKSLFSSLRKGGSRCLPQSECAIPSNAGVKSNGFCGGLESGNDGPRADSDVPQLSHFPLDHQTPTTDLLTNASFDPNRLPSHCANSTFEKKNSSWNGIQEGNVNPTSLDPSNPALSIAQNPTSKPPFSFKPGSGYIVKALSECEYVDATNHVQPQLKLLIEDRGTGRPFSVHLRDQWMDTTIHEGDTVNVIGKFEMDDQCIIDRYDHFLIVHPDVLVSSSNICSSLHCPRQALLNERFSASGTSDVFLMGTLRHRLFQSAMTSKRVDHDLLSSEIAALIRDHLEDIQEVGKDEAWAREGLIQIIPKIQAWFKKYMLRESLEAPVVEFGREIRPHDVIITDIVDIEDMVWSPAYGLKGIIDATVRVSVSRPRQHRDSPPSFPRMNESTLVKEDHKNLLPLFPSKPILPFELKTGEKTKGYDWVKHRAQVMIYQLLCSERYGEDVRAGLLHYLHGNSMSGVVSTHHDLVGIIMTRNEYATNLVNASRALKSLPPHSVSNSRSSSESNANFSSEEKSFTNSRSSSSDELVPDSASQFSSPPPYPSHSFPPMLQRPNSCKRCVHLNNCLIHHKIWENGNAESSGVLDFFDTCTAHLTERHEKFLRHWERLIDLEEDDVENKFVHLWGVESEELEKMWESKGGGCMGSLKMMARHEYSIGDGSFEGRFVYEFMKIEDESKRKIESYYTNGFRFPKEIFDSATLKTAENVKNCADIGLDCDRDGSVDVNARIPFEVGETVILSREDFKPMICNMGRIEYICYNKVKISLPKKIISPLLNRCGAKKHEKSEHDSPLWRIDKIVRHGFSSTLRSNLYRLFVPKNSSIHPHCDIDNDDSGGNRDDFNDRTCCAIEGIPDLRAVIVDLQPPVVCPKFCDSMSSTIRYVKNLSELNSEQKDSIIRSLTSQPYTLISGVPGSGKSTTIAHLIKACTMMKFSVLFTAYTHSALDNVLLKLLHMDVQFMRIGNVEKIHPTIIPLSYDFQVKNSRSVEEISQLKSRTQIMAVTSLGLSKNFLQSYKFDVCIVDEASQMTLPVCLGPILLSDKFVLVGDVNQLPPLVKNLESKRQGMDVSLFHSLSSAHPSTVCSLTRQYRMCQDIMFLSNSLAYDHSLSCGSDSVANSQLFLPNLFRLHKDVDMPSWVLDAIDPKKSVILLDTDGIPALETHIGHKIFNMCEVNITMKLTAALVSAGMEMSEIGLISPYLAQVSKLKSQAADMQLHSLEIDTVDSWQGREKDCCIVTFVRSFQKDLLQFPTHLSDVNRINVAITRSRKKLILVGSIRTLKYFDATHKLVEILCNKGWVYSLPSLIRECDM